MPIYKSHIAIRVYGESGDGILERILDLPFIPPEGMRLELRVGNLAQGFKVESVAWSEQTEIFFITSSWETNSRNTLRAFKEDPHWRVTSLR